MKFRFTCKIFLSLLSIFYSNCLAESHYLSFVMPCYNCSDTVARSIDSIYTLNLSIPFEVVCTDDASTDNTLEILRLYQKKHNNLRVYAHEKNKGGGSATNTCVRYAQGDLLFRLDSDNVLIPDSVQKLIDLLDASGCDGASFQELRFFTGDLVFKGSWINSSGPNNVCDLLHCINYIPDPVHSGNYLYTRKSFNRAGGYTEEHGSDTFCFGFKQYATGSRIAILPNSYYWHYYNENGYYMRGAKTGANWRVALDTLKGFKEVFSPRTRAYLESVDPNKHNPFDDIEHHKLQLASPDILNLLFRGHMAKENGDITEAISMFGQAIKRGHGSEKIEKQIAELEKEKIVS